MFIDELLNALAALSAAQRKTFLLTVTVSDGVWGVDGIGLRRDNARATAIRQPIVRHEVNERSF
jgi:Flp pilus assembly protein protease CpaA